MLLLTLLFQMGNSNVYLLIDYQCGQFNYDHSETLYDHVFQQVFLLSCFCWYYFMLLFPIHGLYTTIIFFSTNVVTMFLLSRGSSGNNLSKAAYILSFPDPIYGIKLHLLLLLFQMPVFHPYLI